MLFKRNQVATPQAQEENPFAALAAELAQMAQEGNLPEGFDLEEACQDPAFAALLGEMPPNAAMRVYAAEQRAEQAQENAMQSLAARQQARASLPLPTRGGSAATATPDYTAMSPAAFRALEAQMKAAARNGKKVRI